MASGSKLVLYAALGGNLAIAATKFVAATITGSSSMLTEGIHSLVDTGNQVLMLYGRHRSQLPADALNPLGHGRELYFWSFVVALLIFTAGAGVSIYEGIIHVRHGTMPERPAINFGVLGIAFIFESVSLSLAVREFLKEKGEDESWWRALRSSKNPAVFVVLLEDSAALSGIVVAAIFIALAMLTGNAVLDGVGSILIGCILAAVAILLARECKALLIGERADPEIEQAIQRLAGEQPGVAATGEILTIHLAPDQVLAMITVAPEASLGSAEIARLTGAIRDAVTSACRTVDRVIVQIGAPSTPYGQQEEPEPRPAKDPSNPKETNMYQQQSLGLTDARNIIAAGERKAQEIGVPYNLAVVDAGGNLVAHARMDGAWIGSIDIAIGKAFTARAFDMTTEKLAQSAQSGQSLFGIHATNGSSVVIFGGGAPIERNGEVIGAVGASGGKVDQDIAVVTAAVAGLSG